MSDFFCDQPENPYQNRAYHAIAMQRKGSVEQDTYGTSANKGEHTTRTREVRNDKTVLN